jgi:hypothetical protein
MLAKNAVGSALALTLLVGGVTATTTAEAASYASRSLNLPNGTFELGLGAGLGHGGVSEYNGLGINLELGYGISSALELRARTGLRFGQAAKSTDADKYGRPVETETYNLGSDSVANPELGLRFNLVRGGTAEIAADARIQLPLDGPLGMTFGVPLALRLGNRVRFDTGLYLPVLFADSGTAIDISIPLHLWIKVDSGTFFGPIFGVTYQNDGPTRLPFGIGIGTSLAYDADLRFWLLFDNMKQDRKDFGAGVGLYVQF